EAWSALSVIDGTDNFSRSGVVSFTCPQIEETAVNNKKNYWIRARIAAGGYGAPAGMVVTESATQVVEDVLAPYVTDQAAAIAALTQQGYNFGYAYQAATWTPPFIQALAIGCTQVVRPQQMTTLNGFEYGVLDVPVDGRPFAPPAEEVPTFYLGLDCEAYESEVADGPMTLFFAPASEPGALPAVLADEGGRAVDLVGVDYLSPDGWKTLTPIRTGSRSSRDGVAIFQAPTVFPPALLLGQTRRWLRLQEPSLKSPNPILSGIYLNVAPAVNAVSQSDVILGGSTGAPDQTFQFPQKSILAGPSVKVLEPLPATFSADDSDLKAALDQSLQAADATGGSDLTEAWVPWKEVSNFDFSTPASRHYLLDHSTGQIAFGDGVRGQIPPQGKRNIQAFRYRSGGGPDGNVPAGTLDTLKKAIPGLGPLRNVMDAVGGVAADAPDELPRRAPAQVRSQGLAVTLSDFANVALEASQDVIRAVCEDTDSGTVRLSILPRNAGQTPTPGFDLTSRVEAVIRKRALPLLSPYIVVAGPDYPAIAASITVALKPGSTQPAVRKALTSAYALFLNPLTGGPDGQGWRFGSRVTAASVAEMAGQVAGVAFVDGVSLGEDLTAIDLAANQLPQPGPLSVVFLHA
ncbi:MAG: putative baseplate assembly protein, partial [Caulobacteraceae bacterium]